jgi:hypothetical protein
VRASPGYSPARIGPKAIMVIAKVLARTTMSTLITFGPE